MSCGERNVISLYFMDGDYLSLLPYVWYYVVVRSRFNMLVMNACPGGPMCLGS